jgi:hypothetical protein
MIGALAKPRATTQARPNPVQAARRRAVSEWQNQNREGRRTNPANAEPR